MQRYMYYKGSVQNREELEKNENNLNLSTH